jgi:hypothetical protein
MVTSSNFWREARWHVGAVAAGLAVMAVVNNYSVSVSVHGPVGVLAVAAAAAVLFILRKRRRFAYALLELLVAAALAWHAATALQLAAAVYVAVRGADNLLAGLPEFLESPLWLGAAASARGAPRASRSRSSSPEV